MFSPQGGLWVRCLACAKALAHAKSKFCDRTCEVSVRPRRGHVPQKCRKCDQSFLARPDQRYCSMGCKPAPPLSRDRTRPDLLPSSIPTDLEIAWAAGIYEGEGWISRWSSSRDVFSLGVAQKDPWILYRLRSLFGGKVSREKRRELHIWRIHGRLARQFALVIWPFLSPHRQTQIGTITQAQSAEGGRP